MAEKKVKNEFNQNVETSVADVDVLFMMLNKGAPLTDEEVEFSKRAYERLKSRAAGKWDKKISLADMIFQEKYLKQ